MQWTVRPYTPADEAEWDRFVMHESGNGTFLQTRNFLNYHPAGRFTDASLMVYNEHGGLGAVVPAALRMDGATRIFRSHPGSTFGGPVLRSTYNSAAKSIGILQAVEDYIATRYDAADFRPTPDLFNGVENVALQYAFTYLGYTQQTELSTWVPVAGRTPETLLASFRQNKKQDVKKALKQDLTFRKLETRAEIDASTRCFGRTYKNSVLSLCIPPMNSGSSRPVDCPTLPGFTACLRTSRWSRAA